MLTARTAPTSSGLVVASWVTCASSTLLARTWLASRPIRPISVLCAMAELWAMVVPSLKKFVQRGPRLK